MDENCNLNNIEFNSFQQEASGSNLRRIILFKVNLGALRAELVRRTSKILNEFQG